MKASEISTISNDLVSLHLLLQMLAGFENDQLGGPVTVTHTPHLTSTDVRRTQWQCYPATIQPLLLTEKARLRDKLEKLGVDLSEMFQPPVAPVTLTPVDPATPPVQGDDKQAEADGQQNNPPIDKT